MRKSVGGTLRRIVGAAGLALLAASCAEITAVTASSTGKPLPRHHGSASPNDLVRATGGIGDSIAGMPRQLNYEEPFASVLGRAWHTIYNWSSTWEILGGPTPGTATSSPLWE